MSTDKRECKEPVCKGKEKIDVDGSCTACLEKQILNPDDNKKCMSPECPERSIVGPDGRCKPCEDK